MAIGDYADYTCKFYERLEKLDENYLEHVQKKRKLKSMIKQAPSTLNISCLPDDIDHIHRAEAAMAARINEEIKEPK
jgi:hypothetical protein